MPDRKPNGHAVAALVAASEIPVKPVNWIFKNWIAEGKFHLLAGRPETLKTTVLLNIIATISAGFYWPDGSAAPCGDCILWSGEDSPEDTLIPRLLRMGADLNKVKFVTGVYDRGPRRSFNPASDMPAILAAVRQLDTRVLLIGLDPVVSVLGKANSQINAETRIALQPFVDVLAALGCAGFGIHHLRKGSDGDDPLERLAGAGAFGALPRIVWLAARRDDPMPGESRFVISKAKCSIGSIDGKLEYDYDAAPLFDSPDIEATRIIWHRADNSGRVREILEDASYKQAGPSTRRTAQASDWLSGMLSSGPATLDGLLAKAANAGFTESEIKRARRGLAVTAYQVSGNWHWRLG